MAVLLEGLLPLLYPGLPFQCVSHEGKNDLEKSIPRKLRAWREPGVRFVIIRDNDGGDCRRVKELVPEFQKVSGARRVAPHLTRDGNRSRSYQALLAGVETLAAEL